MLDNLLQFLLMTSGAVLSAETPAGTWQSFKPRSLFANFQLAMQPILVASSGPTAANVSRQASARISSGSTTLLWQLHVHLHDFGVNDMQSP